MRSFVCLIAAHGVFGSEGGYDSCSGTWSVGASDAVYAISLGIDHWTPDSTFVKEKKGGRYGYTDAFVLTKEGDGIGLALALAAGDRGYIYFCRKKGFQ